MTRVLFVINIDLDFRNDYGLYIHNLADSSQEEEWLQPIGSRFNISNDVETKILNEIDDIPELKMVEIVSTDTH